MEQQTAVMDYTTWQQPFEIALRDMRQELRAIFMQDEHTDRFINAVWLAFRKTPQLQNCTPESIKAAGIQLAQSGLDITQPGEAWLIPMENTIRDANGRITGKEVECVVWDGYIGRIKLAKQCEDVEDIWADEVRENDTYRYQGYDNPPLHQYPDSFNPRGSLIGVYAVARYKSGFYKAIQMSKDEIIKFRDQYSKSAKSAVWQETYWRWGEKKGEKVTAENRGFAQMAKKTVINQLCHPRHINMPRHCAAIITGQEASMQRQTITNEDMQPKQPVLARKEAADELFPDAPKSVMEFNSTRKLSEEEAEHKQQILAEIREDFHEIVYPLMPNGADELCQQIFGVATFQLLVQKPLDDLLQCMPSWRGKIEQLKKEGVDAPESTEIDSASQEPQEEEKGQDGGKSAVTVSDFLDSLAPHCAKHNLSIGRIIMFCCQEWNLSDLKEATEKQRNQLTQWITTEGGRKNLTERMGV